MKEVYFLKTVSGTKNIFFWEEIQNVNLIVRHSLDKRFLNDIKDSMWYERILSFGPNLGVNLIERTWMR